MGKTTWSLVSIRITDELFWGMTVRGGSQAARAFRKELSLGAKRSEVRVEVTA